MEYIIHYTTQLNFHLKIIFYHKVLDNIPNKIKDIFPVFFDYDIENKWYDIEKINGITISELYTNMNLNIQHFDVILNTLNRIHTCEFVDNVNINIYGNYSVKLKERYINNDYSSYENSDILYDNIFNELIKYEQCNYGKKTIIHGDPVFTNIIINSLEKIKLIDMRGKCGNILTIYGDKYYDCAKILQSLIGYDEILSNTYVSSIYKDTIIKHFFTKFNNDEIYNIKLITKSLLFTLLPLHNDENKKIKYYELINSKYLC